MFLQAVTADFRLAVGPNTSFKKCVRVAIFDRGLHLLFLHRLQVRSLDLPFVGVFVARILWYLSATLYGCEISYLAKLHPGIRIPHPIGIVIGYNAEIETGTQLQQNITLGTRDAHLSGDKSYRLHVKENCFIGPGATILGTISIGPGALIGANSVVIEDVPANATAVGVPARIVNRS